MFITAQGIECCINWHNQTSPSKSCWEMLKLILKSMTVWLEFTASVVKFRVVEGFVDHSYRT